MPNDTQNSDNPDSPLGNDLNIPSNPQVNDEEGIEGSMPDPEKIEGEDTLEDAQDVGLYENADEEHPAEANVAEEIDKAEEDQLENG